MKKFEVHDKIKNKRSGQKYWVVDAWRSYDPKTDITGMFYKVYAIGKGRYKYISPGEVDNYEFAEYTEQEIADMRKKADEAAKKLSEYCKQGNGAMPITPNILGKLLS